MTKPTITTQAIFDRVATHLLTQNAPALNADGGCVYRGMQGLQCAVGCLIPDDKYDPYIEGESVSDDAVRSMLPFEVTEEQLELLTDLQMTHDDVPPHTWPLSLEMLARRHGLNFNPPVPK